MGCSTGALAAAASPEPANKPANTRGTTKPPAADAQRVVQAAALAPLTVYPPVGLPGLHEVVDGRARGLYIELIGAVSRASGIPMTVRSAPWPQPLEALNSGAGDVMGPVMGSPSTFREFAHSQPIMRVEWTRYVRRGEARGRAGISFQGVRFAVLDDSYGTRWLKREHPSALLVEAPTIREGLLAVVQGKADAFLGLKLPSRHLLQQAELAGLEEVGTELTAPMSLAFAPSAAQHIPAINAAIDRLAAQGRFEDLLQEWTPPAPATDDEVRREQFTIALAVMAMLLLGASLSLLANNRRLRRARAAAEEARRAKGQFLAVISHEIRTPINGLVNLIDLLQRTPTTHEQSELLSKAAHANRALLSLVNQVLDFSKIEADRMELHPRPMRMQELMETVQAVLSAQTRNPAVALVFDPLPPLPAVQADAQRLAQVLTNLGGNALKFTERGEVRLSVTELDSQMHGVPDHMLRLRLQVSDTGVGISPDQIPRLFQPFVQLQQGWDRPHQGTGLGLSTSAELVRQMGSELKVDSVPGQRTNFWFELVLPRATMEAVAPLAAVAPMASGSFGASEVPASAAPGPAPVPATEAQGLAAVRPIRHVMVVDDNPLNLMVTRKILEQEGRTVVEARSAEEALVTVGDAGAVRPDLVLMDLQMPQVDGIEATRRLRALWGRNPPPVLAVTGAVTEEAQAAALEAGMAGFLAKPFDRRTLMARIAELEQGRAAV